MFLPPSRGIGGRVAAAAQHRVELIDHTGAKGAVAENINAEQLVDAVLCSSTHASFEIL